MIGLVVTWVVALTITAFTGCGSQLSHYWQLELEHDVHCIDVVGFNIGSAITDAIMDIAILVLPLTQVSAASWMIRCDPRVC